MIDNQKEQIKATILELVEEMKKRNEFKKVYYWKNLNTNPPLLTSQLGKINLVMHNGTEMQHLLPFIVPLLSSRDAIYISVTKTYAHLEDAFKDHKTAFNKTMFVDCASNFLFNPPSELENGVIVDRPTTLRGLFTIIQNLASTKTCELIIVDALSDYITFDGNNFRLEKEFSQVLDEYKNSLENQHIILLFNVTHASKANIPVLQFNEIFQVEVVVENMQLKG